MREYVYIWHQPATRHLVLSGITFADFVPYLEQRGGIVLLQPDWTYTRIAEACLDAVRAGDLKQVVEDDPYDYGNFIWADYAAGADLEGLSDDAIAELRFFEHMQRPYRDIEIPGLGNRLLCWAHDNGWHANLYYAHWHDIRPVLLHAVREQLGDDAATLIDSVSIAERAIWIDRKGATDCEATADIDGLLKRHYVPQQSLE